MPENDSTPGTSKRKAETTRPVPLFREGEVYFADDLPALCGVGKDTVSKWKAAGLRIPQPGTRKGYIRITTLVRFWEQHPDLDPRKEDQ